MYETPRPYSDSSLWTLSRTFYENTGQAAWNMGEVPFIVTSSVGIAKAYAQIARAWLRDAVQPMNVTDPVSIIELGTGAGRFGFYFIKALRAMVQYDRYPRFRYIMSDVSLSNLEALQARPELRPFIEDGTLDFVLLDLTQKPNALMLRHAGTPLPTGPTLAIANYVFDSLPADAFFWDGTKLHEWLLGLEGQPLEDVHDKRDVPEARFSDPALRTILSAHCELHPHSFLLHTGAMHAIDHLRSLAGGRLCVILGDKGIQHPRNMSLDPPQLQRHSGSVSSTLNFFAMSRFVCERGGVAIVGPQHHSLNHALYGFGFPLHTLREMIFHFEQAFSTASPADVSVFLRLVAAQSTLTLELILRALAVSHGDPNVLHIVFNALLPLAREPGEYRHQLLEELAQVEPNLYYTGDRGFDVSLELGALFAELGNDLGAIRCFRRSVDQGGNIGPALLSAAAVAIRLKQHHVARAMVERLRTLEVSDTERATMKPALALLEAQIDAQNNT